MSKNADQVISIRLPHGTADRLRVLTATPISTLTRLILLELLRSEEARVKAQQSEGRLAEVSDTIRDIVQKRG